MNQSDSMRSLSDHRKVASSFRDELLFDIFNLSCSLLRQVTVSDEAQVSWCSSDVINNDIITIASISNVATKAVIVMFEI